MVPSKARPTFFLSPGLRGAGATQETAEGALRGSWAPSCGAWLHNGAQLLQQPLLSSGQQPRAGDITIYLKVPGLQNIPEGR